MRIICIIFKGSKIDYTLGNGTAERENYTYNDYGNIESIEDKSGNEKRYLYDGLGQLIREDDLIQNKSIHQMFFSYDEEGKPLACMYNGSSYYYQTNLRGDVVGILHNSGVKVAFYILKVVLIIVIKKKGKSIRIGLLFNYRIDKIKQYIYLVNTRWVKIKFWSSVKKLLCGI